MSSIISMVKADDNDDDGIRLSSITKWKYINLNILYYFCDINLIFFNDFLFFHDFFYI